jgi:hypothetical protein
MQIHCRFVINNTAPRAYSDTEKRNTLDICKWHCENETNSTIRRSSSGKFCPANPAPQNMPGKTCQARFTFRSLSSSTIYHSVHEYNQFMISYIWKHLLMCQNTGKHDWIKTETKANDPDSSARQSEHACFLRIFTSVVKHISLSTTFICLPCT